MAVSTAVDRAVCTGRACRKGREALPPQEVSSVGGYHPCRRSPTVVSTWSKGKSSALSRKEAATQKELPWKQLSRPQAACVRASQWYGIAAEITVV